MSYETPPRKPILRRGDDADETRAARRLLDTYEIDFELREPAGPSVVLEWNGVIYAGLFGVTDFLMFVGRLPGGQA
jgi:hypothetical protein